MATNRLILEQIINTYEYRTKDLDVLDYTLPLSEVRPELICKETCERLLANSSNSFLSLESTTETLMPLFNQIKREIELELPSDGVKDYRYPEDD